VSVVIIPTPNAEIISEICARFEQRKNVSLSFDDGLSFGSALTYAPPLRVIAAGRGENLMMFARAAHSLGIDCAAYSPDAGDAVKIKALGGQAEGLVIGQHDHDYEVPLLRKALESEAFYIGAMGSRTTHDARLMALREIDSSLKLSRLRGPIGLVPSMRDAGRLAVSVLAEIIAEEGAPF